MKRFLSLTALFMFLSMPVVVHGDGSEVVVLYNNRSPESKSVADHYAKMRNVPGAQVYGFALTTNEVISRAEFRDSLQKPLAKKLEADGLWKSGEVALSPTNSAPQRQHRIVSSKIRYLVICYGVPLKIAEDPTPKELIPPGPVLFQRNEAAVDSELTLLPQVENKLPEYGPLPNGEYGTADPATLSPTNGILMVARLDGPNAEVARGLVDKALQAERDGLWGRGYFDARGLPPTETNYIVGDQIILGAARISQILGYETVVDDQPTLFRRDFPMSQIAFYAGWYTDDYYGPFRLPKVEFMPGAFAYHLHSYSAATIRSATNYWVGPLLAKGATCTMGCVNEPLLRLTPDIALFMERWAVNRFTFGEAAWASQPALSWQTTVVGDPLYRPFGKQPEQLHADLAQRNSPMIEWSFLRLINGSALHGVPKAQLIDSLENLPMTKRSAVLMEKLATVCDAAGKPTSAVEFYEQALELNPSPQQKIRIHLALADKFEADGKKRETYDELRKILAENPGYLDKFEILKRSLNLAIALGDKDEITRCTREMQENPPVAD